MKKPVKANYTNELIESVKRIPTWNDDPHFFKFESHLNTSDFSGDGLPPDEFTSSLSLERKAAYLKSACEALERYSLSYYKKALFIKATYEQLLSEGKEASSPRQFCYFTPTQLKQKKFHNFNYSESETFHWTSCTDLIADKPVLVPAQLIYCPYKYENEKVINLPISTGAALGQSQNEAVFKGICEVIERDAFITGYLLSIPPVELIFDSPSQKLRRYLSAIEKFCINMSCFELTSDLEIPTILCIIWGDHSTTPAIAIGLKTELDLEKAVIGAIEEAFQIRDWLRRCLLLKNFVGTNYTENVSLSRAKFWSNPDNRDLINTFLKSKVKTSISSKTLTLNKTLTYTEKLARALILLKKNKITCYTKDITHPVLVKCDFKVSKVIIPDLHPHFLDENYPYYGGKRLELLKKKYSSDVNKIPHPFL